MRLSQPESVVFVPSGLRPADALSSTTHLAVAAHPDDVELMALDGILDGFGSRTLRFSAVVVTDGAGSPRAGTYSDYTNEQMRTVRRGEQMKAATVGDYAAVVLLDHTSAGVRRGDGRVTADIETVLATTRPDVVYTHNPADSHDTHVAVCLRTIEAIRRLPASDRPTRLLGCEVWRDLDWLTPQDRISLDVSGHENLAMALIGVHDSQISGGKRYDLAAAGRRRANATFSASHSVDSSESVTLAIDLTPLIVDDSIDVGEFVGSALDRFTSDVRQRIRDLREPTNAEDR